MTITTDDLAEGYRSVDATIHDVDDKAHLVAVDYPIILDSYRSDFGPSCFEDGWRQSLPPMHVDHDPVARVGRAIKGQSLSDRHRVVGQFDKGPRALRAFEDVRNGVFPGWSFYYHGGQLVPHPSGQSGAVRVTKATMGEFGPVRHPAIPGTRVAGLRSRPPEAVRAAQRAEARQFLDRRCFGQGASVGFRSAEDLQAEGYLQQEDAWHLVRRLERRRHGRGL
jgi:phage head maturation protease